MKDVFATDFSRKLAAVTLFAAPLLLLTGSLFGFVAPENFHLQYVFGKAGFVMFVFAAFVLTQLIRPQLEKTGIIGGGIAVIGAVAGAILYSYVYLANVLHTSGAFSGTVEQLFKEAYMVQVWYPAPGPFFPLGLTILAVCLFVKRIVPRPVAFVLAAGAISFPFGRIPGNINVFLVTDMLLSVSMGYIGWRLLTADAVPAPELKLSET
jgi:hypothetical protein